MRRGSKPEPWHGDTYKIACLNRLDNTIHYSKPGVALVLRFIKQKRITFSGITVTVGSGEPWQYHVLLHKTRPKCYDPCVIFVNLWQAEIA